MIMRIKKTTKISHGEGFTELRLKYFLKLCEHFFDLTMNAQQNNQILCLNWSIDIPIIILT